jgi:hypothetical protein
VDKQRVVRSIERLLDAKDEPDFLLRLSMADLERLGVSIRGKVDKWEIGAIVR